VIEPRTRGVGFGSKTRKRAATGGGSVFTNNVQGALDLGSGGWIGVG
jgi:hypothetical protein